MINNNLTIVEFFDGISIVNMASCISMNPKKIIFIGERKLMADQEAAYRRFVESYGVKDLQFDFRAINKDDLEQIVYQLTKIVCEEENCAFDLTGGEDLVLVAMGMVYEKYHNSKNIKMHRFNMETGIGYDAYSGERLLGLKKPNLSVKTNITLYGGCIISSGEDGNNKWNFDNDFESDITKMWEICKYDPDSWNYQIEILKNFNRLNLNKENNLKICIDKSEIYKLIDKQNKKDNSMSFWDFLNQLKKHNLILGYSNKNNKIFFTFKNEQVRKCFTKEGTLLELIVLLYAKAAKNDDGSSKFDDAVSGVYIDWDSIIHGDRNSPVKDTRNEIDVILIKGFIPVFISCKNGTLKEDELYKLKTVAEKFGGPFAKKVLIATYCGKKDDASHKSFVQRADDMGIELIESCHLYSKKEFIDRLERIG